MSKNVTLTKITITKNILVELNTSQVDVRVSLKQNKDCKWHMAGIMLWIDCKKYCIFLNVIFSKIYCINSVLYNWICIKAFYNVKWNAKVGFESCFIDAWLL